MFIGHNFHTVGYGLPTKALAPGARHKWYFTAEEAERFARENAPASGFTVKKIDHVFVPGDSLISVLGVYPLLLSIREDHFDRLLSVDPEKIRNRGKLAWLGYLLARRIGVAPLRAAFKLLKWCVGMPLYCVDEAIRRAIWGWGSKYRYLNVFCSQTWIILERSDAAPLP